MQDEQDFSSQSQPEPSAPPQRASHAGAGGGDAGHRPRRFSAQRKLEAVQRLLRGEALEDLSRELNVTAARLSEWRDKALAGAFSAMKERERDERDEELAHLKAKLGEITMSNELLEEKIARLEAGRPLARRRSRP